MLKIGKNIIPGSLVVGNGQIMIGNMGLGGYTFCLKGTKDLISSQTLPAANYDGIHWGYDGTDYGADEYARGDNGEIVTHGGYEVLNGKTDDISDAYWTNVTVATNSANEFQATAANGRFLGSVATINDTTIYTMSFYAYVEDNGNLSGYRIWHSDSATGIVTNLPDLTNGRKRYNI